MFGAAAIALSGDTFLPPGFVGATGTSVELRFQVRKAFTVKTMGYEATTGGTGGTTIRAVIRRGGVDTSAQISVDSTDTTGTATGLTEAFAVDDIFSIRATPTDALSTSPVNVIVSVGVE